MFVGGWWDGFKPVAALAPEHMVVLVLGILIVAALTAAIIRNRNTVEGHRVLGPK